MKHSALFVALACLFVAGCNHVPRASAPDKELIFNRYDQICLNQHSSGDVLVKAKSQQLCNEELLSQSESVITYWGQRGDYAVAWFNTVAFDEDSLTAKRKYAFLVDEDSPGWWVLLAQPSKKLRLDMELELDSDVLNEPYADQSSKRIAIIKEVHKVFMQDMVDIRQNSQAVDSSVMLINSVFCQIIEQLDRSPALAQNLYCCKGTDFDHTNLNQGKIRLKICEGSNFVKVKIKIGEYTKDFETHCDVVKM